MYVTHVRRTVKAETVNRSLLLVLTQFGLTSTAYQQNNMKVEVTDMQTQLEYCWAQTHITYS